jgi:biopolymer transport protein ExbB
MHLDTTIGSLIDKSPVVGLLAVLSVFAVVIAVERAIVLVSSRDDILRLRGELRRLLARGERGTALRCLEASPSYEARIAAAGLCSEGSASAGERMVSERQLARISMEHNLEFLRALGWTAPFIGLLGSVVGVIRTFRASDETVAPDLREAMLAGAVGVSVALLAIVAFKLFERVVQERIDQADLLGREVLAYLEARGG